MEEKIYQPLIHGQLIITHQCQLNCTYCFESYKDNNVMTLDTCKKIITFLSENNTNNEPQIISFFGGEPLLHFNDIMQPIIDWNKNELQNKNLYFTFTTNGLLLTEDILQYCKDNNIKFMLSIDGNKESQDATRKYKNNNNSTFDKLSENIPNILKYFPNTTARLTIDVNNISYLADSIKYLDEIGFQNCHVIPDVFSSWSSEIEQIYKDQLNQLNEYFIEKFTNYIVPLIPATWKEMMIKKIIKDYLEENNLFRTADICLPRNRCGFCFQRKGFFETNGDIYTCGHLTNESKDSNFYLGNIYDNQPIDINKIESLYSLNKENKIFNKNCDSNCPLFNCCTGGCLPNNYLINNNLFNAPDAYCSWYKNLFNSVDFLLQYFDKDKKNILFKNYFYGAVKGGCHYVC